MYDKNKFDLVCASQEGNPRKLIEVTMNESCGGNRTTFCEALNILLAEAILSDETIEDLEYAKTQIGYAIAALKECNNIEEWNDLKNSCVPKPFVNYIPNHYK